MKTLEVLFTPADFAGLERRNLDDATCVVLDVFRATSSMITALASGASAIVPVGEIPEALDLRHKRPASLLAGERDGVRITAELTGGIDFDLGNSPREFTADKVSGRTIIMTTTNGTRALRSCSHAGRVFIGSFLNLQSTADRLVREKTNHLLLVCSGTFDQAAFEDLLAAGALCDRLWGEFQSGEISDAALIARSLFQSFEKNLAGAAASSRNGRRLLGMPELKDDVAFCLRQNVFGICARLQPDGEVRADP